MSKPALLSLQLVLKKCFQSLQNNQNMWNSVLHECTPLMVSLCNLAEQLRALQNINIANTTLHDFPDLQERLHYKLVQAVDIVLGKLSEKMSQLQSLRDSFSNQVSGAFQLYEQNSDSLGIAVCCHRSATAPSISDMLEWLQDAERYYRQQYGFLRRTVLLQLLTPNQVSLLETAAKRWASLDSPHGQDSIADTLFKVSFFVEAP